MIIRYLDPWGKIWGEVRSLLRRLRFFYLPLDISRGWDGSQWKTLWVQG